MKTVKSRRPTGLLFFSGDDLFNGDLTKAITVAETCHLDHTVKKKSP